MEFIKKIQQFFNYWYVRYLLATELYMVDTWERVTVHIILGIFFTLFWYFNYSFIVGAISQLRNSVVRDVQQIL